MSDSAGILVLAPNWLGDAVMALPAIADIRQTFPAAKLTVAARGRVAGVFRLVPFVDEFVTLRWNGRWWHRDRFENDVVQLREAGSELAILLPNSFASAWLVRQAAVPERWGYASQMRRPLLSRAVPRPSGSMHQGAYYQHLTRELGIDNGPLDPTLTIPDGLLASAREMLACHGWTEARPLVAFAPGAAYGTAKRWIPASVARVVSALVRHDDAICVLVGSAGDSETTGQIVSASI